MSGAFAPDMVKQKMSCKSKKKLGIKKENMKSLLAVISRFSSQGTVFFLAHRTLAEH